MILYILKSALCMATILGFYHLVLDRHKMPIFNRIYLLLGIIYAIVAPVITVRSVVLPDTQMILPHMTSGEVISPDNIGKTVSHLSISNIAIGLYALVTILMLIRLLYNVITLLHSANNGHQLIKENMTLVLLDREILPYSFFNYIFLSRVDYENHRINDMLLSHEAAHVHQRHSWDIIIVEVIQAFFWFNPLIILYKNAIRLNHEVLADDAVISEYNEISTYQYLLVDTIKSCSTMNLASSLNYSFTKKRLNMMNKKSSRLSTYLSGIISIPLFVMLLITVGKTGYSQATNTDESSSVEKTSFYKEAAILTMLGDDKFSYKKYSDMTAEEKNALPSPPPPPPGSSKLSPIEKGGIVYIDEEGNLKLDHEGLAIPPPPPSAPPAPPTPPAMEDFTPPPPPSPPSLSDHMDDLTGKGAIFKYKGEEITAKEAKKIVLSAGEKLSIQLTEHVGQKPIIVIKD